MSATAKEVIEFWKFIEILQTRDFKPTATKKRNCFILKKEDEDAIKNLAEKNTGDSDYDFCCYAIKKSVIEEYFIKNKSLSDEKRLEISRDTLCLFGFQLDNDFHYNQQKQSFYVSPYIWYLNELLKNNKSSFDDYKNFNDSLKNTDIKSILENETIGLFDKIERLKNVIVSKIDFLRHFESDIQELIVAYFSCQNDNSFINHESQLFNSYIIDDLELVSQNITANESIADYILALTKQPKKQIDVKKDMAEIRRILSKEKYPLGKWPSMFYPSLMQQLAVNYAIEQNRAPLFSVNGPPGTGKTTLLKEIIADTIVKRAREIANLSNANEAFERAELDGISFYKVKNAFLSYSMLVTSCNNAAVENITKELPEGEKLLDALKGKEYADFFNVSNAKEKISYKNNSGEVITDTYFNQLQADFVNLNNEKNGAEISRAAVWGTISAPLGKKSNIERFCNSIISGYVNLMGESTVRERKEKENIFHKAKEEFNEQLARVEQKRNKLNEISSEFLRRIETNDPTVQTERPSNITEDYDAEREKLFCKAINLQKTFVLTADCLPKNLFLLRNCFITPERKEDRLSEKQKKVVFTDCFLSLFFLVPVISSTFASMQRMFKYISEPKKIGTLIIDEAGQATPQQALGAMYRSQKYVIVGDPMQVEPVVTTSPEVYENFLSEQFSENIKIYAPGIKSESVQTFADRLNTYGAHIKSATDDASKWVGCPLIVHRRCMNPMFKISNELSYGNTMINATKSVSKEDAEKFLLQNSCWIDVSGKEQKVKNHFIKEQLDAVKTVLSQKKEHKSTSIFVITPFVSVKSGFSNELQNIKIGTVHTFQGKEAEEVFLVLGCDEKATGAVAWVNANILNVAVTRAKYRFYVVGDWDLWKSNPHVAVMQKYLERKKMADFIQGNKIEEENMAEEVKKELRSIADKIDQLTQDAYEKGRKAACTEIAEKLRNENIDAGLIEEITGVKTGALLPVKNTCDFEEFTKKYTENYKIEVTLNKGKNGTTWANFKINESDENYGWNTRERCFAKNVFQSKLYEKSKEFFSDFETILTSLSADQIKAYWA